MRYPRAVIAVLSAVALALSVAPSANADNSRPPTVKEWSNQLAAPFSLAVDGNSRVLIADGGTGVIGQLTSDGSVRPLVSDVPGLAGLATRGAWMAYGSSDEDGSTEPPVINSSGLNIRRPSGGTVYADTHAYEYANNPDGGQMYGVTDPATCADPMSYPGLLDSHVYAVASWRGDWLVADAGANAIFRVTDKGRISTLAVLPPVPVTVTAEMVAEVGAPECYIGDTYWAEAVPTGVAIGRGGEIYVSTLPGAPGEAVSQGQIWKIDPRTGNAKEVASGLSGPTSIAVSGSSIYAAELFGSTVSVTRNGSTKTFVELPGALSVAAAPNGTIWAATMASEFGPGAIVSISSHKVKVRGHFGHR